MGRGRCASRIQCPEATLDLESVTKIFCCFRGEEQLLLMGKSDPRGITTPTEGPLFDPDHHAKYIGKNAKIGTLQTIELLKGHECSTKL